MHIHDAYAFALLIIRWRENQAHVEPNGGQNDKTGPQPGYQLAGKAIKPGWRSGFVEKQHESIH